MGACVLRHDNQEELILAAVLGTSIPFCSCCGEGDTQQ